MIQEDIVRVLVEETMWLSIVFLAGFLILSYILTVKSRSVQNFAGRFPQVYMILILVFLALLANVYFNFWLPLINGGK
jgi:hypothetical protein